MQKRLGIVAGVIASVIGALVMGEYEFQGTMPYIAGPVFGLVIGEVMAGVGKTRTIGFMLIGAAIAATGLWWAGWIDSGEGLEPYPSLAYVAAGLGAAACAFRLRPVTDRS